MVRERKSDSPYDQARDRLTRYLAERDHSRLELQRKLMRNFAADLVDRLLEEADRQGWLLPEEAMAERAVRELQRRHKSSRYIQGHLRQRGLPEWTVDPEAELQSARVLVERRFGREDLSHDEKLRASRYLAYRGFSPQVIQTVTGAAGVLD